EVQAALQQRFPGAPLRFSTQQRQDGTADAVRTGLTALDDVSGPVLVLYGDTPLLQTRTLESLVAAFRSARGPLALLTTHAADPAGYGRILRVSERLTGVVEERDCTVDQRNIHEVNAGVYVFDAAFLRRGLASLTPTNAQGELYLTDLVALAAREGEVASVHADFGDTRGVNDRADLAAC